VFSASILLSQSFITSQSASHREQAEVSSEILSGLLAHAVINIQDNKTKLINSEFFIIDLNTIKF
jgi:hypothetical protein